VAFYFKEKEMEQKLCPGYHVFTAVNSDTLGFEACARALQAKVNEAEKEYDIQFFSGASFKDDPASRNVYFGQQTAFLTRKKK
jgi:hypothetical protein